MNRGTGRISGVELDGRDGAESSVTESVLVAQGMDGGNDNGRAGQSLGLAEDMRNLGDDDA